jgi:hypothetical protein
MKLLPLSLILASALPLSAATLATDLVAYWDFESGTAANSPIAGGSSAYDGTLMGGATLNGTPRVGSGALQLDGADDYMAVSAMVDANLPWSVSAWFRSDIAAAGTARNFVFESGPNYSMSFGLREGTPASATAFEVFTDVVPNPDVSQRINVPDTAIVGVWHHILLTSVPATAASSGSIIGYLNGTAQYSLIIPAGSTLNTVSEFRVGTFRSGNGRFFDGVIDEVAIWSRALAPGEASEVHALGFNGQAIPEPSLLLPCAAAAAAFRRRRR